MGNGPKCAKCVDLADRRADHEGRISRMEWSGIGWLGLPKIGGQIRMMIQICPNGLLSSKFPCWIDLNCRVLSESHTGCLCQVAKNIIRSEAIQYSRCLGCVDSRTGQRIPAGDFSYLQLLTRWSWTGDHLYLRCGEKVWGNHVTYPLVMTSIAIEHCNIIYSGFTN
jgi:hypothetical protein